MNRTDVMASRFVKQVKKMNLRTERFTRRKSARKPVTFKGDRSERILPAKGWCVVPREDNG